MNILVFVDSKILFSIIILLTISIGSISIGPISAQELPLISIKTDDTNYDEGDTVVISGSVRTVIGETPLILQLFIEGSLKDVGQLIVAQDGSFSETLLAEGGAWKKSGNYTIVASYQGHQIQTEFSFTTKSEVIVTSEPYTIDTGEEDFDIEYTIKGGTVKNMEVNFDIFAVVVQINATDIGTITLDLPRELIEAKEGNKDVKFIILIDGTEAVHEESIVSSDSRVIDVNFEPGDSNIEIIGTYVIPEFGIVVMMILVVGIMVTIMATRNKLQIKI